MEIARFDGHDVEEMIHLFYDTVHSINARDYAKDQLNVWASLANMNEKKKNWEMSFNRNITFIALVDHKIRGFIDLEHNGYLNRLFVHKDFQGQGIASALLYKIEQEAKRLNMPLIYTHASITAMPFFKHKGYEVIREQTVQRSGVLLKNYHMQRQLAY